MGKTSLGDFNRIKEILNLTTTDNDAEILLINAQISDVVELFILGPHVVGLRKGVQPFDKDDLVEYFDGGFVSVITHRNMGQDPDQRDTVAVTENGTSLVQGTDFHIDAFPSRTVRRLAGEADNFNAFFTAGRRNVRVTYAAEDPDPDRGIAGVVESAAARAFLRGLQKTTGSGYLTVSQRSPESGDSLTYRIDDFSPQEMRTLNSYKAREQGYF